MFVQSCTFYFLNPSKDSLDVNISGITTPFAYIGSWGSHFTWHTEDMDLYSMNILIEGAPKVWYCVPPQV